MVCDGTAIARAVFSENIRPGGCRIEVLEADPAKGMVITATDRAMYHEPRALANQLAHRQVFSDEFAVGPTDGGLLLRSLSDATFECTADPAQGWKVVMWRRRSKGDDGIEYETSNSGIWDQQAGVWYVREFTEEEREDGTLRSRTVWKFDEFEVNPVVSGKEFTWQHLDLCAEGVVADRRPDAPVGAYRNVPSASEQERRLETLVERVKALPPRSTVPAQAVARIHRGWIVVCILAAAACAVGAYLLRRERQAPGSGKP